MALDNLIERRNTIKLIGIGLGSLTAFACGVSTVVAPSETDLPPTIYPETSTPELLPIAPEMNEQEIKDMLSVCGPDCADVKTEDVATFVFDSGEKLAFFKDVNGTHIGKIYKMGLWSPIYGTFDETGTKAFWIEQASDVTQVAPGEGVMNARVVFEIDLSNKTQGPYDLVASYIGPDNFGIGIRIPTDVKPGKVAWANPIKFEVPIPIPEHPPATDDMKLPQNAEFVQDKTTGTWYIVDKDNQDYKVYRFPDKAKNWEERQDVVVGEGENSTTYEGWLKDSGSTEVETGVNAGMEYYDKVTDYPNKGFSSLYTGNGYLTNYRIVEITNGEYTMDLIFFKMKYFLQGNRTFNIDFRADRALVERLGTNFKISNDNLGESFNIRVHTPFNKKYFGNQYITYDVENYHFNKLQIEVNNNSSNWIKLTDLLNLLKNPQDDLIDLTNSVRVDLFGLN